METSNRIKEGVVSVTKCFSFCYGHRLPGYDGKCSSQHGHNASVEVEVSGRDEKAYPTMVTDFAKLKSIVEGLLLDLDHKDLTEFFPWDYDLSMQAPPTAETICQWLAKQIQQALPEGVSLVRLRVSETPTSWAEWKEPTSFDLASELRFNPYMKQALVEILDRRYGK